MDTRHHGVTTATRRLAVSPAPSFRADDGIHMTLNACCGRWIRTMHLGYVPGMRVLMVSQFYPPVAGGQEQHVRNLAHALVERGHRVEVVTIAADGPGRNDSRRVCPGAPHPDDCPTSAPPLQRPGTAPRDADRGPWVSERDRATARCRPFRHRACSRLEHRLGHRPGPPRRGTRGADPARLQPCLRHQETDAR